MLILLQHGADVRSINAEGNSAYNVAMTSDIRSLIEGSLSDHLWHVIFCTISLGTACSHSHMLET